MYDAVLLVAGAVVGYLVNELFQWGRRAWSTRSSERKIARRRALMEGGAVTTWLLGYYEQKGVGDELYRCRIGKTEATLPFLTRPEWQNNAIIAPDDDDILDPAPHGRRHFPVDEKIIKRREALGQTLFDDPTLYLDEVTIGPDGTPRILYGVCRYFQMVTALAALEEETFAEVARPRFHKTPIRDRALATLAEAEQATLKPLSVGCTAALAVRTEHGYDLLIQSRSHATVTYGGTRAVIPNFGLAPVPDSAAREIGPFFYNYVKEYCEELFDFEDLIALGSTKRTDPLWFLELEPARELLDLHTRGLFTLERLGFGMDGMNGVTSIALLARIEDPEAGRRLKKSIIANWEVSHPTDSQDAVLFVDAFDDRLAQWLEDGGYQYGSAFTISLAQARLKDLLATDEGETS